MAHRRISFPVKTVQNEDWAHIGVYGERHEFCAEDFRLRDNNFSFADGHRVRVYSAKKNVHWKIPPGIPLDISQVPEAQSPPRRLPKK